jgi:hypothetical protein
MSAEEIVDADQFLESRVLIGEDHEESFDLPNLLGVFGFVNSFSHIIPDNPYTTIVVSIRSKFFF